MERWFYSVEDFTSEIDISVPPSPQDLNIPPGRSTMQSLEETLRWHCKESGDLYMCIHGRCMQ